MYLFSLRVLTLPFKLCNKTQHWTKTTSLSLHHCCAVDEKQQIVPFSILNTMY